MKRLHIVPSIFVGGPVGLVAAGLLGNVLPAPVALAAGAALGMLVGFLVVRGVCRPTV